MGCAATKGIVTEEDEDVAGGEFEDSVHIGPSMDENVEISMRSESVGSSTSSEHSDSLRSGSIPIHDLEGEGREVSSSIISFAASVPPEINT